MYWCVYTRDIRHAVQCSTQHHNKSRPAHTVITVCLDWTPPRPPSRLCRQSWGHHCNNWACHSAHRLSELGAPWCAPEHRETQVSQAWPSVEYVALHCQRQAHPCWLSHCLMEREVLLEPTRQLDNVQHNLQKQSEGCIYLGPASPKLSSLLEVFGFGGKSQSVRQNRKQKKTWNAIPCFFFNQLEV